jgi:hypothetical protein
MAIRAFIVHDSDVAEFAASDKGQLDKGLLTIAAPSGTDIGVGQRFYPRVAPEDYHAGYHRWKVFLSLAL